MKALPSSLSALASLQTLNLDGCIGLTTIPPSYAAMSGLKTLHATHCQRLLGNAEALAVLPATVTVVTESKRGR